MEVDETNEEILMCCSDNQESEFDRIVGFIEDIIIGDKLERMLKEFMEKYYTIFEDKEENKLEYITIFQEYQTLIEKYIEHELTNRLPGFQMTQFIEELLQRQDDLDCEIFQILMSFTDFVLFKELMLDYKKAKDANIKGLHDDLIVTSLSSLSL